MTTNDGGPAFVFPEESWPGMTLRDWFAGQALAGISANPELSRESFNNCARWAYEQADAMLKAREVSPATNDRV